MSRFALKRSSYAATYSNGDHAGGDNTKTMRSHF